MTSSQEKITEKKCNIIEKALQDAIANENTKTLLREYKDFLLDELKIQKENENILQVTLSKCTRIEDSTLDIKCLKLQETVTDYEKYIDQLKDKIDNLTIQSIADNETLKIENAEKEKQLISYYEVEVAKLKKQLVNNKKEQAKLEQEIKNQITLEIATKNARLGDLKGNLQRQIVEKTDILIKMQTEHKELRKELDMLKTQEKNHNNQYKSTSSVMEFHNDALIQKKRTNVLNNRNEFNNARPPRISSVISEYSTTSSTTETGNQEYIEFANSFIGLAANNLGQPNTECNQQNINNVSNFLNKQNNDKDVTNNEQILLEYRMVSNANTTSHNSTKVPININSDQLTNQEIEYVATEYDVKETFSYYNDLDSVNAKILELVPNSVPHSWNAGRTVGIDPFIRNKKTDFQAEASKSYKSNTSSNEHPDMFNKNVIKKSEPLNYGRNLSDVPRKAPTVYIGEIRTKKSFRNDGHAFNENNENEGTTLNTIVESNTKKRK